MGFNPDGTEKTLERQTRECPKCKGQNAYAHEKHPDTGYDEMVLRCPDCKTDSSLDESLDEKADPVKALADKLRKTEQYATGIGRATALYMAKGEYKAEDAPKLALHLVQDGGRHFYGKDYFKVYTPEVREQVMKLLAKYAREDKDKFNHMLPKKYQKGFKGYDEGIDTMSLPAFTVDLSTPVRGILELLEARDLVTVARAVKQYSQEFGERTHGIVQYLNNHASPSLAKKILDRAMKYKQNVDALQQKLMKASAINNRSGETTQVLNISPSEVEALFIECEQFLAEAAAEGEEEGAVNFAKKPVRLSDKKNDSAYVDRKIKQPEPKPEPDPETGEFEEEPAYPFTLDQVQAYYDLQIAQGLELPDAVKKVRSKFGIKDLKVSPAGEIQPVDGLKKPKPAPVPVMPPEEDPDAASDDEEDPDATTDQGDEEQPEECLEGLDEKYDGRSGPDFKTLKKNKVELTTDERKKVMDSKATWNMGKDGQPSPAVWKAEVNGTTWYVTNTHRAYNVTKTLEGTIKRFHEFIKGTA